MAQLKTIAHGLGIMYLLSSGQICQQELRANRPVNLSKLLTSGSAMLTSGHREGSSNTFLHNVFGVRLAKFCGAIDLDIKLQQIVTNVGDENEKSY